ncbi:MAG TPA: acyl-CoA dehydrogenase [Syntrophomonas sp.]|nr:acyl-CoA dehydrogenase [Syntrophomonas sp.]
MGANFAYKNTRDIEFILEEWLPIEDNFACEKYSGYSKEEIKPLLDTAKKMAKEAMEPAYDDADENPARLVDGKVEVPPSYQALWNMIQENGWGNSNMDPDPEAVTLPETLYSACREMFQAANCDFQMYFALSAKVTDIIARFGSERTKKIFLPKLLAGKWSGGMGLTEPSAGSDVGDLLSKAYPTDDPDIYKLKGQKTFISCAGHPLTENNIILCLARVEGALPGSAGVSLFMLPEIWVNEEDGSLEPNDFEITTVEHKMGLHGQPTCAFSYGDNDGCRAWRMGVDPLQNGGRGDGMKIIFNLVNSSRLGNGLWSTALSANATYNARDYAAERVQGYNGKGQRVAVIEHADTRRKLLNGKAITEAGRALVYKGNYYVDISKHHPDAAVKKEAADNLAILVPLAKAYCTDEVWGVVADAIQIYGGYGYCEEYPVAHIARDCKITSILEGTNYIQSWDLISRKMTMGKGVPFQKSLDEIAAFIASNRDSIFAKEFAVMDKTFKAYGEIVAKVKEWQMDLEKNQDTLSFYACKILTATAQLFAGRLLLDQALLADKKSKEIGQEHYDYSFYSGKVIAAKYYINNIVPAVISTANMIANSDGSEVDFDNTIFDY